MKKVYLETGFVSKFVRLRAICVVILYLPGCDLINSEINVILLIKPFFLHAEDAKTKI